MTVDTTVMRQAPPDVWQTKEGRDLLRSAADEIDELRKGRSCINCKRYLPRDHFSVCVQCGPAQLQLERAVHAKTRARLSEEREAHGCAIRLNNELGEEAERLRARLESAEAILVSARNGTLDREIRLQIHAHFARYRGK